MLLNASLVYAVSFSRGKMLFGLVDVQVADFFEWTPHYSTRDHNFKLYKKKMYYASQINLFSERVVNVWNNLPASVDFKSLALNALSSL